MVSFSLFYFYKQFVDICFPLLGFNTTNVQSPKNNTFVSDSNFSSVFGATEPAGKFWFIKQTELKTKKTFLVIAYLDNQFLMFFFLKINLFFF